MAEPGEYIVTARHPKISTLNKAAEGLGQLPDGKKGVISNATKYVYNLPDDAQLSTVNYQLSNPYDVWYVGGITNQTGIEATVKLDFLKPGVKYEATIYSDAPEACGLVNVVKEYNPYAYTITKKVVTSKSVLKIWMQACGGFAISIREKNN